MVENVNWDCEVFRDYSETNMGPWRRIASGITSAFREVEELIVLEDDCLPDASFFRFCDELLERYRDDERIMHIAGNHFQAQDRRATPYSYSFAWHNIAWGYATWRRAWHHFDLGIPSWGELRDTDFLDQVVGDPLAVESYRKIFDQLYANPGEFDGYKNDWAWSFACWSQGGLSVLPDRTLIKNVGFGPDSTHFPTADDPRGRFQSMPMPFPLNHPPYVLRIRSRQTISSSTRTWRLVLGGACRDVFVERLSGRLHRCCLLRSDRSDRKYVLSGRPGDAVSLDQQHIVSFASNLRFFEVRRYHDY